MQVTILIASCSSHWWDRDSSPQVVQDVLTHDTGQQTNESGSSWLIRHSQLRPTCCSLRNAEQEFMGGQWECNKRMKYLWFLQGCSWLVEIIFRDFSFFLFAFQVSGSDIFLTSLLLINANDHFTLSSMKFLRHMPLFPKLILHVLSFHKKVIPHF